MFEKFYLEQDRWVVNQIVLDDAKTPFWRHISYVLAQFDGLYKGHKAAMGKKVSIAQIIRSDARHARLEITYLYNSLGLILMST
jgi:hypothetical protein